MDRHDLLPIGEVAERSGVSVATVRFYEERGLVRSVRTAGNQRRFERHALRRIAVVRAGQRFGLTLAEVGDALATLPVDRPPTKRDWSRLSPRWHDLLTARIDAMAKVRDDLVVVHRVRLPVAALLPGLQPRRRAGRAGPGRPSAGRRPRATTRPRERSTG